MSLDCSSDNGYIAGHRNDYYLLKKEEMERMKQKNQNNKMT